MTDDHLIALARQFAAAGATPAVPRRAATVLLLRPPLEVYLIRRAPTMAFAAGMYAFPGGTVDPRDPDIACAAVREVFEETGVLLAGPSPTEVVADVSTVDWEEARRAVEARVLGFADLLRQRGLVLRPDLLVPWSRWITPEFEPRRYDTHFFLARLPLGQRTRHIEGEASHALWSPPDRAGGLPMLPPTRVTLAQLAAYRSVDEAWNAAADRDLTPVRPRVVNDKLVC
jgi:8-oxo-dGTP pyrophosphatase MutT (NUDIX family)